LRSLYGKACQMRRDEAAQIVADAQARIERI
jgi:hypothetical protein